MATIDPLCSVDECFACMGGHCRKLTSSYGGNKCPFFKTPEQVKAERKKTVERLKRIGRENLIVAYMPDRKDRL